MANFGGMTWDMQQRAKRLIADAPPNLAPFLSQQSAIASGFRSPEQQAQAIASVAARNNIPLTERTLTAGIPGMAAGVGRSKHQTGEALDWNFAGMPAEARNYLTSNAGRYGLQFPLPKTDSVHMEVDPKFYGPVQPVEDGSAVASSTQTAPMPTPVASPLPPPQQAPQSMLVPQEDNSGLVGMFRNAIENPLTMAGLGLMSSSAQGKDIGTGLINGIGMGREADKWAQERQKTMALKRLLAGGAPGMEGVPPALLAIAQATGDPSPIAQHIIKGGGTDDIKEYEYAKARGFQGSLQDWLVNKRASQGEYAKQLVYGSDAQGNIVPMQAGSRGDLIASKMPPGVQLQRDPIKVETATGTVLIDPTTRQQMGFIPKNVAEAARQGEIGKGQGQAQVDLPKVESSSKALMDKIQAVENDPNLANVTGWQAYLPTIQSTSRDTEARISQLGGSAFLQAFESLKGGGAITEVEGQKATQALARLTDLKQSDEGFKQALRDFAQEVARLQELARTRAANGIAPQQPQTATPGATLPQGWSIQKVQ